MRGEHIIKTPFGNAIKTKKGYLRLTTKPYRNRYVHRVSFEAVAGRPIKAGFQVHHMHCKTCFAPYALVELDPVLHKHSEPPRHPYTGRFLNDRERRDWL